MSPKKKDCAKFMVPGSLALLERGREEAEKKVGRESSHILFYPQTRDKEKGNKSYPEFESTAFF